MKTSEAFYSSFEYVTELTSHIFSVGHRRYFANDSIFAIGLFILGQLAKFVIGFPLGLIVGLFAAGIVALINLFKPERTPKTAVQNNVELELGITANPIVKTEKVQSIEANLLQEKIAEKSSEINKKSLDEKKEKFIHCINLLTQYIDQKLTRLQPSIQPYAVSLQRVEDLKRQLYTQSSIAASAKKLSHNVTTIDYKLSCACGRAFGTLKCGLCKGPIFKKETRTNTPVYVADSVARQAAQTQSQTISLELKKELNKYPQPPLAYEIKKQLVELNSQLRGLLPIVRAEEDESNLLSLLSQYKQILAKVESQFSAEDHFQKADFIPKSDYAQHYVAVKMVQQLARQNGLFQSMPQELKEQIALFTTSSVYSQEDARYCFNHK